MNLVNIYGQVVKKLWFMTQHELGQVSRPESFCFPKFYFKYFKYFDNA